MKSRITSTSWLMNTPIAHRGLHGHGVPENSISAFRRAIENGYPIETDVQMTSDGKLFCFHDDSLKRMTGLDSDIRKTDSSTIELLRLRGSDEKIPTFEQFLKFVDGRVPLLIEVKKQKEKGIEEKIADALADYDGEYAIQSFDPFVLKRFSQIMPEVLRGQLSDFLCKEKNPIVRFVVKRMIFNFLSKPDFCNVNLKAAEDSITIAKGLPTLVWTVRSEEDLCIADAYGVNFVFENILAKIK